MKTEPLGFGFEVLITYFLPGIVVALGILVSLGLNVEELQVLVSDLAKAEFLVSFALVAIVTLLGASTASAQAIVETYVLDPVTAWLIRVSRPQFDEQWVKYVQDLPNKRNPYIARVVLFFQFETRMGLAMMILCAFLLYNGFRLPGWLIFFGGLLFYAVGFIHHKELAEMRKKYYGENAVSPFVTMSENSCLPSKSRLAAILVVGIFGYSSLEYSSLFFITDFTNDQRTLFNRFGIFLGFLGAIVGGHFLFWDLRATKKEERARAEIIALTAQIELLKTLETEIPRGFAALVQRNADEAARQQETLAEAQKYLREKGWIGWMCLVLVVASAVCQFIGASDGS